MKVNAKLLKYIFSLFKEPQNQSESDTKRLLVEGIQGGQMMDHVLLQREMIETLLKCIDKLWKSSSPEPLSRFQQNLASNILG